MDRDMDEVSALLSRGYEAFDAEDWALAGDLLAQAAPRLPHDERGNATWFDAALAYKFARDWPRAYTVGKQAAALVERGREEPAFWNLAIAATALRDWDTARDSWAGYGIPIPPGDGEIIADFGVTCVRITTELGKEVVWARRLCPTRARVASVPFHPGRRFGEVILHDGAPTGEREVSGGTVPVFDEISVFAESPLPTLSVTVDAAAPADLDALADLFWAEDLGVEPLGSGVNLCACCSEGTVRSPGAALSGRQTVLLGAPDAKAREILDRWVAAAATERSWENLHLASRP